MTNTRRKGPPDPTFTPPVKRQKTIQPSASEQLAAIFSAADLDRDGLLNRRDVARVSKALVKCRRKMGGESDGEDEKLEVDWGAARSANRRLISKKDFVTHLTTKWKNKIDGATKRFEKGFSSLLTQCIGAVKKVSAYDVICVVFDALDANGDGCLSREEFAHASEVFGEMHLGDNSDWKAIHSAYASDPEALVTRHQCIQHWFSQLKTSGAIVNGHLTPRCQKGALEGLIRIQKGLAERLFNAIDRNHDGFVTKREVLRAATALGHIGGEAEKKWRELLDELGKTKEVEDYKVVVTKQEYISYWIKHFRSQMKIRGEEGATAYGAYILDALERLKTLTAREICEEFFRVLDRDHDGYITMGEALMCHNVFSNDVSEGKRIWKSMLPHNSKQATYKLSRREYTGYWMRELESKINSNDHFHPKFARILQSKLASLKAAIAKAQKGPIRHVVLFNLKPHSAHEVCSRFAGLETKIEAISDLQWGPVTDIQTSLPGPVTHCFLLSFTGVKDRDIYLTHPDHVKFVDFVDKHLDKATTVFDFAAPKCHVLKKHLPTHPPPTPPTPEDKKRPPVTASLRRNSGGFSSTSEDDSRAPPRWKVWRIFAVHIHTGADPVLFAKGCKDAALKTRVTVKLEWGSMANHPKEIQLAHGANHILIARFRNEASCRRFGQHDAWKAWMRSCAPDSMDSRNLLDSGVDVKHTTSSDSGKSEGRIDKASSTLSISSRVSKKVLCDSIVLDMNVVVSSDSHG